MGFYFKEKLNVIMIVKILGEFKIFVPINNEEDVCNGGNFQTGHHTSSRQVCEIESFIIAKYLIDKYQLGFSIIARY